MLGPLPVIVGILLGTKFVVSYAMLRDGIGFRVRNYSASAAGIALLTTVAMLVGFTFSLPFPNLYRGQVPPNQWHNTTTMVVMPVALWTFWAACRYIRRPSARGAAWIAVAGLISVAAKPNFAMAFVPAFPVQMYLSGMEKRWKRVGLIVTGVIGTALVVQYFYMYHTERFATLRTAALIARGQEVQKWGLVFSPFTLWRDLSPAIPVSIVSMLLFPVLAAFARPEAARKSRELAFAWLILGFSLLAFVLFDETGRLVRTANFRWGAIVAMYILFLVSVAMLLEPRRDPERRGPRHRGVVGVRSARGRRDLRAHRLRAYPLVLVVALERGVQALEVNDCKRCDGREHAQIASHAERCRVESAARGGSTTRPQSQQSQRFSARTAESRQDQLDPARALRADRQMEQVQPVGDESGCDERTRRRARVARRDSSAERPRR